jgi:hypothetical protein
MKAVAVQPGQPRSIHLEDVRRPSVDEILDGRGVRVQVLRVGVDGSDKEINAGEYGAAPPGDAEAYEIQRRVKIWEPRRACILGSGTVRLLMALAARLRALELTVLSLPRRRWTRPRRDQGVCRGPVGSPLTVARPPCYPERDGV